MMRIEKTKKGFTLIELLVVVAIIGILAAIAIPQFSKYRSRAYNSAAQSDLRNVQTALEGWFADNQEYPTIAQTAAGDNVTFTGITDTTLTDEIPVSQNVGIDPKTTDETEYAMNSKHENGGTICYGATNSNPSVVVTDQGLNATDAVADCTAP